MAKNRSKIVGKSKKVKKTKVRSQTDLKAGLDLPAIKHLNMLVDPCGAELAESVYPGDRGYINRFVLNGVAGVTATHDSWAIIMKPGNGVASYQSVAGAGTASAIGYSNSFPGTGFAQANASKMRTLAACITVRPIAAPNNATGTIHFGVVNAQTLANGISVSPSILAQYCTDSVSSSQAVINPLEVKWCPGSFDDRYSPPGAVSDDDSDRNVLLIVGIGFPPGTGVQTRMTTILEWAPLAQSGIVADATAVKRSLCDKDCILSKLKAKDPDWWWSLGKKVLRVGKAVATGYGTGGAVGALGAVVRYM